MVGAIVYQERLKRLVEQLRAMADAGTALAPIAHDAADFLQHQAGAGRVLAPQQAALELRDQ